MSKPKKPSIDTTQYYDLDKALELLKQSAKTKFDETAEVHFTFNDFNIKKVGQIKCSVGKQEIKSEPKFCLLHSKFGKISFNKQQLKENFLALYKTIARNKPPKQKKEFVKKITICSTMGPGIKINLPSMPL